MYINIIESQRDSVCGINLEVVSLQNALFELNSLLGASEDRLLDIQYKGIQNKSYKTSIEAIATEINKLKSYIASCENLIRIPISQEQKVTFLAEVTNLINQNKTIPDSRSIKILRNCSMIK